MLNKVNTCVERIIAKIDNDFNPDGSDWIPRTISWIIDGLSQIDALRVVPKRRTFEVKDRIVKSYCPITNNKHFRVYDSNGCELSKVGTNCSCLDSSTGDQYGATTGVVDTDYNGPDVYQSIGFHNNTEDVAKQTSVYEQTRNVPRRGSTANQYVIVDNYTIELTQDAKSVIIETDEIETVYSDYYKCDIPVIPNNGILIEALTFYCMYKMLCRGMKHPVFNLNASQYGTNPYYQWTQLKDKARASVIIDAQKERSDNDNDAWRSYFYDYTFPK